MTTQNMYQLFHISRLLRREEARHCHPDRNHDYLGRRRSYSRWFDLLGTSSFGTAPNCISALAPRAPLRPAHFPPPFDPIPQPFPLFRLDRFLQQRIENAIHTYIVRWYYYWDSSRYRDIIYRLVIPGWGRQTGRTFLENFTDLRSFSRATSWLKEFISKFLWRITTLTALMIGTPSVFTYWSWSPRITRILDRFSLQTLRSHFL